MGSSTPVRVPAQVFEAMVAHGAFMSPAEACGLIAVDEEGDIRMVYCLTNVARSPVAFTIDPDEHFSAILHAERQGWSIGGAFHSHPRTPAVPSQSDVAGALDPEWLYLIVGLAGESPELRGWSVRRGVATEVMVEVMEDSRCR